MASPRQKGGTERDMHMTVINKPLTPYPLPIGWGEGENNPALLPRVAPKAFGATTGLSDATPLA